MKLRPKLKIEIAVLLLVFLFLSLNFTYFKDSLKNFFYLLSSPLQKSLWGWGSKIANLWDTPFEIQKLKREVEELKKENQALLTENIFIKELKKENEILRKALDIGLQKEFKLEMVEVISKDILEDTILINKGSKDGIFKNFPVVTPEKVLVGKISEVYADFARVQLVSHKESSFDAKIVESEIQGVVKGRGNSKIFLEFVPKEKEIKEGDLVITTALGGVSPKGLLVGEVKKIRKSDIEPLQEIEILPSFSLKKIENLFLITDY